MNYSEVNTTSFAYTFRTQEWLELEPYDTLNRITIFDQAKSSIFEIKCPLTVQQCRSYIFLFGVFASLIPPLVVVGILSNLLLLWLIKRNLNICNTAREAFGLFFCLLSCLQLIVGLLSWFCDDGPKWWGMDLEGEDFFLQLCFITIMSDTLSGTQSILNFFQLLLCSNDDLIDSLTLVYLLACISFILGFLFAIPFGCTCTHSIWFDEFISFLDPEWSKLVIDWVTWHRCLLSMGLLPDILSLLLAILVAVQRYRIFLMLRYTRPRFVGPNISTIALAHIAYDIYQHISFKMLSIVHTLVNAPIRIISTYLFWQLKNHLLGGMSSTGATAQDKFNTYFLIGWMHCAQFFIILASTCLLWIWYFTVPFIEIAVYSRLLELVPRFIRENFSAHQPTASSTFPTLMSPEDFYDQYNLGQEMSRLSGDQALTELSKMLNLAKVRMQSDARQWSDSEQKTAERQQLDEIRSSRSDQIKELREEKEEEEKGEKEEKEISEENLSEEELFTSGSESLISTERAYPQFRREPLLVAFKKRPKEVIARGGRLFCAQRQTMPDKRRLTLRRALSPKRRSPSKSAGRNPPTSSDRSIKGRGRQRGRGQSSGQIRGGSHLHGNPPSPNSSRSSGRVSPSKSPESPRFTIQNKTRIGCKTCGYEEPQTKQKRYPKWPNLQPRSRVHTINSKGMSRNREAGNFSKLFRQCENTPSRVNKTKLSTRELSHPSIDAVAKRKVQPFHLSCSATLMPKRCIFSSKLSSGRESRRSDPQNWEILGLQQGSYSKELNFKAKTVPELDLEWDARNRRETEQILKNLAKFRKNNTWTLGTELEEYYWDTGI
ncbi:unnamed protein product [Protopolystoma xenopodis]|uniref:Uncharacterized protein n=1 Tax=Protopolystoma xenopodis TaxID=117903 RepID=A0A3S5CPC0_9PLAT|nr:unnamed protein product [Protopolystoma xenopodis]